MKADSMSVNDIYNKKRKIWNSLKDMRISQTKEHGLQEEANRTGRYESESTDGMGVLKRTDLTEPQKNADINAPQIRIQEICDPGSFQEHFRQVKSQNPLQFPGYEEKRARYQQQLHTEDAFLCGTANIRQRRVAIGVLDGRFLMGSMGCAVGEKITLLAEFAQRKRLPLIIFSASGGARMQEGMFSLMQMAKTASAIERYKNSGGLFISCLTHPTTGGVSASYASLGDIILAEPNALICFAGPRVIEQTIGQTLPEGFQRSEFLLEHGMIDKIVERTKWQVVLNHILRLHGYDRE